MHQELVKVFRIPLLVTPLRGVTPLRTLCVPAHTHRGAVEERHAAERRDEDNARGHHARSQRHVFEAAAFAARAHKDQTPQGQETPYFSHPVRVCLVVRQVFGFDDPKMLAAALLHDTIEDTTTDYDDLVEAFGPDVANWVAALSKDLRLPQRRTRGGLLQGARGRRLAGQGHQARPTCTTTSATAQYLDAKGRKKTVEKSRFYLDAVARGTSARRARRP